MAKTIQAVCVVGAIICTLWAFLLLPGLEFSGEGRRWRCGVLIGAAVLFVIVFAVSQNVRRRPGT